MVSNKKKCFCNLFAFAVLPLLVGGWKKETKMQIPSEYSSAKRIFIGSLPSDITENVLHKEFSNYGEVEKVDIKSKGLGDTLTKFAFINLSGTSDQLINKCLNKFANQQFHGHYLKVEVARESFLDRLKREWADRDSGKKEQPKKDNKVVEEKVHLNSTPKIGKVTKFDEKESSSDSSSESDEDETNAKTLNKSKSTDSRKDSYNEEENFVFIAKKSARSSLQNGKLKITSVAAEPIHIISKKTRTPKQLEGSAQQSDQKRKQSLHKMKDQYNKNKETIKQALTNIDAMKSRKIVFDDGDESPEKSFNRAEPTKQNLFDGDDSNDDVNDYRKDFQVKEQFQGAKGEKLMKLQSKFKSDSRFAMDTRFLEGEDGDGEEFGQEKVVQESSQTDPNADEERQWQLGIIEQVVGKKLNTQPITKKPIKASMTRFDPSNEEHQRFIKNSGKGGSKQYESDSERGFPEINQQIEVSKEQFYKVSDDFVKAVKTKTQGFSLLSMFGRAEDTNDSRDKSQKYSEIPLTKHQTMVALNNPFKYDSSDSEDEVGIKGDIKVDKEIESATKKIPKPNGSKVAKIPTETFFIFATDKRLGEGAAFFKAPEIDPNVNFDDVKRNLRNIINRKILNKRKFTEGYQTVKSKFKKSRKG